MSHLLFYYYGITIKNKCEHLLLQIKNKSKQIRFFGIFYPLYSEVKFLTFAGQKVLDGLAPGVNIINRFLRKATKSTLENYMEILHW